MGNEAEIIDPETSQETWRDRSRPIIPRIVFVSGGMGGIGTAICRRLGQTGHTVVAGCLPGYEQKDAWLARMKKEGLRVHASLTRARRKAIAAFLSALSEEDRRHLASAGTDRRTA